MVFPLNHTNPGDSVRIVFLANNELTAGRLRDLGFESGAVISCVMQRPKKNIAAYLVRNAVIALRAEDSRLIFVREAEGSQSADSAREAEGSRPADSLRGATDSSSEVRS